MSNPFDYINSINRGQNIMVDDLAEKEYNPFLTNRGLSFYKDTVLQANEMNRYYDLDHRLQYLFLINSVSPKKRFSKWFKAEKLGDLDVVKEYYGYSNVKAKAALNILTPEQIEIIRTKIYKGGPSP